ncbi:MAG: class B sortase [Lachnospiraceae bacterium]|jgi:sortase B|nr:class B sortase [Lachnospiraceae bacterium]
MKKYQKYICLFAAVCLLGTAALCGRYLYSHYARQNDEANAFEEIAGQVRQIQKAAAEEEESSTAPQTPPAGDTAPAILPEYANLLSQNPHLVGWIQIEGTTINYPVVQTPQEPDYYLKRSFDGEYSKMGTPYLQADCDVARSDNLLIYGHHIKGGKMFGALMDYTDRDFYEEHKIICFDTLMQRGQYEILAVFKITAYREESFRYYDFVNAKDEESFRAYVETCKELSLYDTGITAEYGDRLITLSTCEYSVKDGRLVVVAKEIEPGNQP